MDEMQIVVDKIKCAGADVNTWEIPVQTTQGKTENFHIDDIDLQRIVMGTIGRSLDNSTGCTSELADLKENWEKISSGLYRWVASQGRF